MEADTQVLSVWREALLDSTARSSQDQLTAWMEGEVAAGRHCQGCSGVCCTFSANSMQITAFEAMRLVVFLHDANRLTPELKVQLQAQVAQDRLDQPAPGDGRRSFGRRRYTCPFFAHKQWGCTISRQAKPRGCLAFHPTKAGEIEGRSCVSHQDRLAAVEPEPSLFTIPGLSWDKQPIPVAVLDVWSVLAPRLFRC